MRGFPIVSLGALLGGWSVCQLISPQFEYDEYYGDKLHDLYYNVYYKDAFELNYLKSFEILPNNLNAIEGTSNYLLTFSTGFDGRLFNTTSRPMVVYRNNEKFLNIKNIRIDSFYSTSIQYSFFFNTNYDSYYVDNFNENIYINAPNVNEIYDRFSLVTLGRINNLYLNFPQINQNIGGNFLTYDTVQNNFYMNMQKLEHLPNRNFGGYSSKERYIISTSLKENERLFSLFNSTIQNEELNNRTFIIPKSEIILVPGETTCTLTDFDIRYWSTYENETGRDSGLH